MERDAYQAMAATEGTHWWFVGRRAIIRSLIERYVGNRSELRILEAGCGTGGNLALLQRFGELTAFERDDDAREQARKVSETEILAGHLPDGIQHIEGDFGLIGLFDVLEHVEQDAAAVHSLASKLSDDGILVATVPAVPALWSDHDRQHHHYRRYSKKQFAQTLEAGGMEIIFISYFNSLLFPLALLQRLASRMTGRSGGEAIPLAPLNWLLSSVFGIERFLLRRSRLPIGLSLCAVCRPATR